MSDTARPLLCRFQTTFLPVSEEYALLNSFFSLDLCRMALWSSVVRPITISASQSESLA